MVSRVVTVSRLRQTYLRFRKVSIVTSFIKSKIEFLTSNTIETTGFRLQKNINKTGTRDSQLQQTLFLLAPPEARTRARGRVSLIFLFPSKPCHAGFL